MDKWPNFFVVGAPRSGTTSLYRYLKQIPGVFMSAVKEPNYFCGETIPDKPPFHPIRDTRRYLDLFRHTGNARIVGEASPFYLHDPCAYKLIHQKSPQARILISLRDPIERAWSHYLLIKKAGYADPTFAGQIQKELKREIDLDKPHIRLEIGSYYLHVKKYLHLFGRNRVKIMIFEEWVKNEKDALDEILKFLDLEPAGNDIDFIPHHGYERLMGSWVPNGLRNSFVFRISLKSLRFLMRDRFGAVFKTLKPEMDKNSRQMLWELYERDVRKLENLLEIQLPWPNFGA